METHLTRRQKRLELEKASLTLRNSAQEGLLKESMLLLLR